MSGDFLVVLWCRVTITNDTSLGVPWHIDIDLHFTGLSFRFIVFTFLPISFIIRWWVLCFAVIKQKSSANGIVINFSPLRSYPCFCSIYFRRAISGLNTNRNIYDGRPWIALIDSSLWRELGELAKKDNWPYLGALSRGCVCNVRPYPGCGTLP